MHALKHYFIEYNRIMDAHERFKCSLSTDLFICDEWGSYDLTTWPKLRLVGMYTY